MSEESGIKLMEELKIQDAIEEYERLQEEVKRLQEEVKRQQKKCVAQELREEQKKCSKENARKKVMHQKHLSKIFPMDSPKGVWLVKAELEELEALEKKRNCEGEGEAADIDFDKVFELFEEVDEGERIVKLRKILEKVREGRKNYTRRTKKKQTKKKNTKRKRKRKKTKKRKK